MFTVPTETSLAATSLDGKYFATGYLWRGYMKWCVETRLPKYFSAGRAWCPPCRSRERLLMSGPERPFLVNKILIRLHA